MRLGSRLGELMRQLHVSDLRLERETRVNREHIQKIRDGTFKSISRRELQILWSWGRQHVEDFDLFALVRHPIWASFEEADAVVVRGKGDRMNALILDARVEHMLTEFLNLLKCRVLVKMQPDIPSPGQVRDLMLNHNCIFLGSPKHNPAATMAIAALWNFDVNETRRNRERVPFWFSWGQALPGQKPLALEEQARGPATTGIYVNSSDHGVTSPLLLKVDWLPAEEYIEWSGTGWDAGALIIARQPLGTKRDVTTIVIAGYTGLGTIEVAKDLLNDVVDITPNELVPGQPILKILRFQYRKMAGVDMREPKTRGRTWVSSPGSQSLSVPQQPQRNTRARRLK